MTFCHTGFAGRKFGAEPEHNKGLRRSSADKGKGCRMALTKEHKEAMAQGRVQSRSVSAYLERIQDSRPRRGRKRTVESISKRLDAIEDELPKASMLKALSLRQERDNLQTELKSLEETSDMQELEDEFVKVAADYGDRKGISAQTWKDAGVPVEVLKRAGIK